MKVRWGGQTDTGRVRDHNEDTFGVGNHPNLDQRGHLFIVCDGMGGHASGEVASQLAMETILRSYYDDLGDDRSLALEQAFAKGNEAVYRRGKGRMGTTGVAALVIHDALIIANVGDSRAYLLRDGELRQITRDHSFVSDQVAAGLITAEEARTSPVRNVITRALGNLNDVSVDLFRIPLQVDDTVILSSDGMHGVLDEDTITTIAAELPPDEAAQRLIERANQAGGPDNITALLIVIDRLDWEMEPIEAPPTTDQTPLPTERLLTTPPISTTLPLTPAITLPLATNPETAEPEHSTKILPAVGALNAPLLLDDDEPDHPVTLSAPILARPAEAPRLIPPREPPPDMAERPLSWSGGLLASLMMLCLVAVIIWGLMS